MTRAERIEQAARALVDLLDQHYKEWTSRVWLVQGRNATLRAALALPAEEPRNVEGEIEAAAHIGEAHGYDLGYRAGVEAAARALEVHGREDYPTRLIVRIIRDLSPPAATPVEEGTP